ncbi:STAS domain-containing protein [Actinoplanes regularis]|uniref:Anti-sigma factor antagonist n=1 Tax=Actinoplanes regularis TaxID=52697 RepID=A0A238Z1F4_9ACTN|nr:STAS domain-containing protein [Actinoplanes regularis]GIE85730.1 hypothetical protein Are01nite_22100 [Actinoplanes regularis]SNR77102.1 anti-anti-sigma regulatory factor, SpoIIAA [Actinoplanes regularis]
MLPAPLWSAQVAAHDHTHTVTITGELDLHGADALRLLLIAELDTGDLSTVIADLADVTFLDSAALGALIRAYQHADDTGRQFLVRNPSRPVQRILEITGVNDILNPPADIKE